MTAFVGQHLSGGDQAFGGSRYSAPLVAVVGYDGTAPSERALSAAIALLAGRNGHLEVVYVATMPATAAVSAQALVELGKGQDEQAAQLADQVRAQLERSGVRWHFQRRDGAVGHELTAVADELRGDYSPDATILMVVGGSAHRYHRVFGSAAVNMVRHDRFPVLVVP
jgi:nucleotide-binding universal stress UspA family protein